MSSCHSSSHISCEMANLGSCHSPRLCLCRAEAAGTCALDVAVYSEVVAEGDPWISWLFPVNALRSRVSPHPDRRRSGFLRVAPSLSFMCLTDRKFTVRSRNEHRYESARSACCCSPCTTTLATKKTPLFAATSTALVGNGHLASIPQFAELCEVSFA